MVGIKRTIVVEAPAARVFAQLDPPRNLLEIWPSLLTVANDRLEPDGRHAFDWTYRMAGVPFRGHCETLAVDRNRLRVDHNTGAIPSTFRWAFAEQGTATEVTLEVEYEIPRVLRLVAGPVIRALNEREGETLLANLKSRIETGVPPVKRAA